MSKTYNIWFCHPYASAPGKGQSKFRGEYFIVNELIKLGHKVSMITSSVEHINGPKVEMSKEVDFERIGQIPYVWLKNRPYEGNGLGRIINMLKHGYSLKKYFRKIADQIGKPDIVLCSAMPAFHYGACRKISKYFQAKLIFKVRDIWPLSLIELMGLHKYHPLCLYVGYTEKKAYKECDSAVCVLDNAKGYMVSRGLSPEKYNWISNGYQPLDVDEEINHLDDDLVKIQELKRSGKFIIGYAGAIGIPNNLEILCDAVSELNDDIQLILLGNGQIKNDLESKYKNAFNIKFIGHKAKSNVPLFLNEFDICYSSVRNLPTLYNHGLSVNKEFEYLFYKKPIIFPEAPQSKLLRNLSTDLMYDSTNPVNSIKKVIEKAKNMPRDKLSAIGQCGKEIIEKEYLYSELVKKYDLLFNQLMSNN
ncbi:glycosyltransferase family 4 protein [Francisellaceae bacterium]|nr:glycosyltransferase family 4 protein [Francisellaceae bacterium]